MLLKNTESETLIEILELEDLFNPINDKVKGQMQHGEEEQPPEFFNKKQLAFPSGENLPICWLDSDYRLKS